MSARQPEQTHYTINALPEHERPRERLRLLGEEMLSTVELLAVVIGTGHGDDTVLQVAENLITEMGDLLAIKRAAPIELQATPGIGPAKARRVKAALELGHRLMTLPPEERPIVNSPATAADLLMPDMMYLEQEHMRVILLDTRNRVLSTPTVYNLWC